MYKYKFQICELAHAQIEEKRGVPAGICRSCIHDPKVVARNTKIDQQIYLLTAGKGLINMKCFLILLNIYNLQIFFCFFISVFTTDNINFGLVISVTFDI